MQITYIRRQGKLCTTSTCNFEVRCLQGYWTNYTLLPKISFVMGASVSCCSVFCSPLLKNTYVQGLLQVHLSKIT